MINLGGNSQRLTNILIIVILSFSIFLVASPLIYMISTSLRGEVYYMEVPPQFIPQHPTLSNFQQAFESRNFGRAFLNSFMVACATSFFTVWLSSMMAYAFARFDFLGKRPIY